MSNKRMKPFWVGATVFGVIFAVLLSIRLNLLESSPTISPLPEFAARSDSTKRDVWMNIFQAGRKIGFSHSVITPVPEGYEFEESVQLKINTMGMTQDLVLNTSGILNKDLSLSSFKFRMNSGRFQFAASGKTHDYTLSIETESGGQIRKTVLDLDNRVYLPSGMIRSIGTLNLKTNELVTVAIFDPISMGQEPIEVRQVGRETIQIMGTSHNARKVSLSYKGNSQLAWIGEKGELLKESGLLGIEMIRTTKKDALHGLPIESSEDLTRVASVQSNRVIVNPPDLNRLKARIDGIDTERFALNGFRQTFENDILTVTKETLPESGMTLPPPGSEHKADLLPTPLIQSDHPRILRLAKRLTASASDPLDKMTRLLNWVYKEIEKRPVLSVPDALSTLTHGVGDCNEHAVLLAALARAVGIPARIEAGLVYLSGRFYYHAWNLVFVGKWISVDALFGQIPTDVTHLRFTSGSDSLGSEVAGLIGKVNLHIMALEG